MKAEYLELNRNMVSASSPSRRRVMHFLGATLAAPIIASQGIRLTLNTSVSPEVDSAARNFILQIHTVNHFTARAGFFIAGIRLLGGIASIATILDYLNIRPNFTRSVHLGDAGGCTQNFQRYGQEACEQGTRIFSGVDRSPIDRNVAVLAARNETGTQRQFTTQFGGADAVTIKDDEPAVVQAATDFIRSRYGATPRDVAHTIALTERRPLPATVDGRAITLQYLKTAKSGYFIHDATPFAQYDRGAVAVHYPGRTDPANLPWIGLHS